MEKFNLLQSYMVAFIFLDEIYKINKSADIGSLLGDMSLLYDNISADPAASSDWKRECLKILNLDSHASENAIVLTEDEIYKILCEFLKKYAKETKSQDTDRLIVEMTNLPENYSGHWKKAILLVKEKPEKARETAALQFVNIDK